MFYKENEDEGLISDIKNMREKLNLALKDDGGLSKDFVDICISFMEDPANYIEDLAGISEYIENISHDVEMILVQYGFFRRFSEFLSLIPQGTEELLLELLYSFSYLSSDAILALTNAFGNIKFLAAKIFAKDESAETAIDTIYNFSCSDNRNILSNLLMAGIHINIATICTVFIQKEELSEFFQTCVKTLMNLAKQADQNCLSTIFFPLVSKLFDVPDPKILRYSASILSTIGCQIDNEIFANPEFYSHLFDLCLSNINNTKFVSFMMKFFSNRATKLPEAQIFVDINILDFIAACLNALPEWNESWARCAVSICESIFRNVQNSSEIFNCDFYYQLIRYLLNNCTFDAKYNALTSFVELILHLPDSICATIVVSVEDIIDDIMFGLDTNNERCCALTLELLLKLQHLDTICNSEFCINIIEKNELFDQLEELAESEFESICELSRQLLSQLAPKE